MRAQGVLNALLSKERQIQTDLSHIPAPAGRATLDSNGDAIPPSNAPLAVRAAIEAANQIDDLPYIWGGGHGSFTSSGYDCSGRRQLRPARRRLPLQPARLDRPRGLG